MRRFAFLLLVTVISCQKTEQVVSQSSTAATKSATSTAAQDLSNANVKTVLPVGQPDVLTDSKLGSKIGADGNVTDDSQSVKASEPVYFSMWLKQSPAGLQTSVKWFDGSGTQIDESRTMMAGQKVATFKLNAKKLKPGDYRVVGYWGGNIAVERDFKMTK